MYDPNNPEPSVAQTGASEGLVFIRQIAIIVLLALSLAFVSLRFFMQAYEVDGVSMETTLQNGDRLIVWKGTKTWYNVRGKAYVPDRYDVVVFDRPLFIENGGTHSVDHLIKRVIGLPGERVVVKDGLVTVYNSENPDGFNPDDSQEYSDSFEATSGDVDIQVGEEEIFVLGDNRNNSLDSRRFGSVDVVHVTGVAEFRLAPVGLMRKL